MNQEQFVTELVEVVRERFLDPTSANQLTAQSPLLEWGILTSMNTAILLNHIREAYGIQVPPQHVTGRNLASVEALATLLSSLDRTEASA